MKQNEHPLGKLPSKDIKYEMPRHGVTGARVLKNQIVF